MERYMIMDCEMDNFCRPLYAFAISQDKTMAINSSDCKYLLQFLRTFLLLEPASCDEVVHLLYDAEFIMQNLPAKPPTNS